MNRSSRVGRYRPWINVLVSSKDDRLAADLKRNLPSSGYEIIASRPGQPFYHAVNELQPQIVVLDHPDRRKQTAETIIDRIETMCPGVAVITVGYDADRESLEGAVRRILELGSRTALNMEKSIP